MLTDKIELMRCKMDIVIKCAEFLDKSLFDFAVKRLSAEQHAGVISYAAAVEATNMKSFLFNVFTVALIASVVLGICGAISMATAAFLGGCSYFGRRVAEESFNVVVPGFVKFFNPNIMKPQILLSFDKIVIFYDDLPKPVV